MKISDILLTNTIQPTINIHEQKLLKQCTQFLLESGGQPLIKNLPDTYGRFAKVKVRFHSRKNVFIETFNAAFQQKQGMANMHQRSIFANGVKSFTENSAMDAFYIFPKNGYGFMYNAGIENSNVEYGHTFDSLYEQFGDTDHAATLITDLLQHTYTTDNLYEGISAGAEIILYNIPFYYAVRRDVVDYPTLLSLLS